MFEGSAVTALELIVGGECSAACLCGSDGSLESCSCRCEGLYHGALASAPVNASAVRVPWWREIAERGTWIGEVALDVPVARRRGDYERIYSEARALARPCVWVGAYPDGPLGVHVEISDRAAWATLDPHQQRTLGWFLAVLDHRERCYPSVSPDGASVLGQAWTLPKAKVIAAVLDYAFHGKRLLPIFKALVGYEDDGVETRRASVTWASDIDDEADDKREEDAWRRVGASIGLRLEY